MRGLGGSDVWLKQLNQTLNGPSKSLYDRLPFNDKEPSILC